MLLESIGDLATLWRIKGPSSIIFSQAKSAGLCYSTLYPMFLLAITCAYILHTLKVACTLACVRFGTLLLCVCGVLSTYFSWVIKYVYVGFHTIYLHWALLLLFDIFLLALFLIDYWTIPFWGSDMLCALHNPKMCIHEEYHLVLIYQYYLLSMWYVILMRNSNSIMSITYL